MDGRAPGGDAAKALQVRDANRVFLRRKGR
jgi:hypothetical protein